MDTKENDGLNNTQPPPVDDFRTRGAAAAASKRKRSNTGPEPCTICLEAIQERAVAAPCNHLSFDFLCLVQWLQEHATCPLCKAEVKEVHYDWRAPHDYKIYAVEQQAARNKHSTQELHARPHAAARRRHNDIPWGGHSAAGPSSSTAHNHEDPSLARRREVYSRQTPSLHVGANRISQYQTFTPSTFATSAALQTRARIFLRRELRVFSFLDRRPAGANREFLVEYLVALLKTHDPKGADGQAEELLKDFLGEEDARLLLHELDAWLRSPYERLEGWDRHVQYAVGMRGVGSGGKGRRGADGGP